jgi:hypothetical protein
MRNADHLALSLPDAKEVMLSAFKTIGGNVKLGEEMVRDWQGAAPGTPQRMAMYKMMVDLLKMAQEAGPGGLGEDVLEEDPEEDKAIIAAALREMSPQDQSEVLRMAGLI